MNRDILIDFNIDWWIDWILIHALFEWNDYWLKYDLTNQYLELDCVIYAWWGRSLVKVHLVLIECEFQI